MNKKRACLPEIAEKFGISISPQMEKQFGLYTDCLLRWNEKMNLTTITDPDDIVLKHYLDSLLPLSGVEIPPNARLLDVGTGAGFPGVPLKIVRRDLQVTLLDSLQKRIYFLQALAEVLELTDLALIHGRAEVLGRDSRYREQFYLVTARAVAALSILAEYCLPFVLEGGYFAAFKGYDVEGEAQAAEQSISLLGGAIESIQKFRLPSGDGRAVVLIRKTSQTLAKYPRSAAKITKSTL